MNYILSPVPIDKLLELSPKKYPELFDQYGNIDLKEYYHTLEGQEFFKLFPIRFTELRHHPKNKKEIITDIFWDLAFISIYYNKDYYIYFLTDNWIIKHFGGWSSVRLMELEDLKQEDKIRTHWFTEDLDERNNILNDLIESFIKNSNLKKQSIWELKIEGVKE